MFAAIFAKVQSFVAPYLNYVFIALLIALAAVTGVFWWQKQSAEAEVQTLKIVQDRLNGRIDALNTQLAFKDLAITTVESTNATLGGFKTLETQIIMEAGNAPEKDDAPVAPVLDRAMRGVGRMLDERGHSAR